MRCCTYGRSSPSRAPADVGRLKTDNLFIFENAFSEYEAKSICRSYVFIIIIVIMSIECARRVYVDIIINNN